MPERMSMMVARITPHCLKQKGMARMLTPKMVDSVTFNKCNLGPPIMELANVMVEVMVMVVPKGGDDPRDGLINRGGHYAPIIKVFFKGHLESIIF